MSDKTEQIRLLLSENGFNVVSIAADPILQRRTKIKLRVFQKKPQLKETVTTLLKDHAERIFFPNWSPLGNEVFVELVPTL